MKKNMGYIDKTIRILVAIAIVLLYYAEMISGIFGTVMLIIAGIFVLTSVIGVCPIYSIFGIKTNSRKNRNQEVN